MTDGDYAPFAATWVDHVLEFSQEFATQYGNSPEPNSTAAAEFSSPERGPQGPWQRGAASRPYELAGGLLMIATAQFLRSLRLLLVPEMALFGFQGITRSTLEASARIAWVLDPAIGVRERVLRGALLELESVRQAHAVELAGGGDGSNYHRQISDLKIRMALLGFVEKEDKRHRLIGFDGEVLPSLTRAVTSLVPHLGLDHGELCYRSLSGVSHSLLYGITEYLEVGEITTPGKTRPVPSLPINAVANAVVLAADSYLFTVQRHAALWGRDDAQVVGKRLELKAAVLGGLNRERIAPPA